MWQQLCSRQCRTPAASLASTHATPFASSVGSAGLATVTGRDASRGRKLAPLWGGHVWSQRADAYLPDPHAWSLPADAVWEVLSLSLSPSEIAADVASLGGTAAPPVAHRAEGRRARRAAAPKRSASPSSDSSGTDGRGGCAKRVRFQHWDVAMPHATAGPSAPTAAAPTAAPPAPHQPTAPAPCQPAAPPANTNPAAMLRLLTQLVAARELQQRQQQQQQAAAAQAVRTQQQLVRVLLASLGGVPAPPPCKVQASQPADALLACFAQGLAPLPYALARGAGA